MSGLFYRDHLADAHAMAVELGRAASRLRASKQVTAGVASEVADLFEVASRAATGDGKMPRMENARALLRALDNAADAAAGRPK